MFDVLCLAPVTPRRYYHAPRGAPCEVGAGVLTNQMQAQVNTRCHSCRRQNGSFVHEQNAGVDVDVRMPSRQFARELPVRGGSSAVQQSGGRQCEGPYAHRCRPRTVVDGVSQRRNHPRFGLFQESVSSWHHHKVGFHEGVQPVRRANLDQTPFRGRADRPALPAYPDLIFRIFRWFPYIGVCSKLCRCQVGHAEDLARDHQLETHDLVQRQHCNDHRG